MQFHNHSIGWFFVIAVLSGCTSIDVRPEVATQPAEGVRIPAKIVFDGNRDYLPRVFSDNATSGELTIEYSYDSNYDNSNWDGIALFNPLSIVGFPSGNNYLKFSAELKLFHKDNLVKSYRAICAIEQQTGLWSFSTRTELRREGLLALRNNIESQVILDRKSIEVLASKQ